MTKKANFIKILAAFLTMIILLFFSFIWGSGAGLSCAATSDYTDVLDDLKKDQDFSVRNYPKKPLDYSMTVIQIGESEQGELFIYVYQPIGQTRTLLATSINISTSINENLRYENYTLTLLNSSETLYKYKVDDFAVQQNAVRYYDISSIYRKWNQSIDGEAESGNTVSEVALAVGQWWTATTVGKEVCYTMLETEVVQITNQSVGFRRYSEGVTWSWNIQVGACDAHFFAFSTKHDIDRLISADLEFFTQNYTKKNGKTTLESKVKHFITLYYDDFAEVDGGGWFGKKARWDRMVSSEEFLSSDLEFTDDERAMFSQYQWVLNFYETSFNLEENTWIPAFIPLFGYAITGDSSYLGEIAGTLVSEVSLMRLEFEYGGKIYNLGVVSNKQSGGGNPSNPKDNNLVDGVRIAIGLIALIVLLVLFYPILSPILNAIAKGIVWIVTAPFKALGKLFDNDKKQ